MSHLHIAQGQQGLDYGPEMLNVSIVHTDIEPNHGLEYCRVRCLFDVQSEACTFQLHRDLRSGSMQWHYNPSAVRRPPELVHVDGQQVR